MITAKRTATAICRRHFSAVPAYADRLAGIGANVFAEFSQLAVKHGAVNLGQGFPSFPTPDFVKQAAVKSVLNDHNQYSRPGGAPPLLQTLATIYSPAFGRQLDPMTNIYTSQGAQLVICHIFISFLNPGDEVIVVEPYFDAYVNAARLVGATVVGVPMRMEGNSRSTADWSVDPKDIEAAITDRTKLLILNTPHNPVGKVTSAEETEAIAAVVRRRPGLLVLSDEVYEHHTFDGHEHIRFANMPGMWDRTITCYSAGKTFSCTGWRLGYAVAPANLIAPLIKCQQTTAFCTATPLEMAANDAFLQAPAEGYYDSLKVDLQRKRDFMVQALNDAGLPAVVPEGGYFIMADTSALPIAAEPDDASPDKPLQDRRDFRAARWLTTEVGVTAIPPSAFYTPANRRMADNYLRFCFVKDDATLEEAAKRLRPLGSA